MNIRRHGFSPPRPGTGDRPHRGQTDPAIFGAATPAADPRRSQLSFPRGTRRLPASSRGQILTIHEWGWRMVPCIARCEAVQAHSDLPLSAKSAWGFTSPVGGSLGQVCSRNRAGRWWAKSGQKPPAPTGVRNESLSQPLVPADLRSVSRCSTGAGLSAAPGKRSGALRSANSGRCRSLFICSAVCQPAPEARLSSRAPAMIQEVRRPSSDLGEWLCAVLY